MAWYEGGSWGDLVRPSGLLNIITDIHTAISERYIALGTPDHRTVTYSTPNSGTVSYGVIPTTAMWADMSNDDILSTYNGILLDLEDLIASPGFPENTNPGAPESGFVIYQVEWIDPLNQDNHWTTLDQVTSALGIGSLAASGTISSIITQLDLVRQVLDSLYMVRYGILGLGVSEMTRQLNGSYNSIISGGADVEYDPFDSSTFPVDPEEIMQDALDLFTVDTPSAYTENDWACSSAYSVRSVNYAPPVQFETLQGISRATAALGDVVNLCKVLFTAHIPAPSSGVVMSNFTGLTFGFSSALGTPILLPGFFAFSSPLGAIPDDARTLRVQIGMYNGASYDIETLGSPVTVDDSDHGIVLDFGVGQSIEFSGRDGAYTMNADMLTVPPSVPPGIYTVPPLYTGEYYTYGSVKSVLLHYTDNSFSDTRVHAHVVGNLTAALTKI